MTDCPNFMLECDRLCDACRLVGDQDLQHTPYGFKWGPVTVTRLAEHKGRVVIGLMTDTGKSIDVYVSRTGRSMRVFSGAEEMQGA